MKKEDEGNPKKKKKCKERPKKDGKEWAFYILLNEMFYKGRDGMREARRGVQTVF